MNIEEFNEIIKISPTSLMSKHNITVQQYRFNSKEHRDLVIWDLNCIGNQVFTNKEGDENLRSFYSSKVFTEEEWDTLLPHIFYRDFNRAFDELAKKVIPLFNRIPEYWDDLHLEFWQGIFSFGTHWCTKDKSLKETINTPENGKLYCNTLLEIYPIFKEFIDKWDC